VLSGTEMPGARWFEGSTLNYAEHALRLGGLADATNGESGELILFVVPAAGCEVDDELRATITAVLRAELSPRHVPDAIHAMPGVPRTLSGKKLEVPVKRILSGAPVDDAASLGALANPEVLAAYEAFSTAQRPEAPNVS